MFTIEDVFQSAFPFLEGISIDVGTVLMAILGLWFLLLGFDRVKLMIEGHFDYKNAEKEFEYFTKQAEIARKARYDADRDSIEEAQYDLMYKGYLKKSIDSKAKLMRKDYA